MPEPQIHAVLHGHFYQPPRENPWTGEVPREGNARPFRDWNSRIAAECYAANGFARICDSAGRCVSAVNNYEHLSFNFGPTLLRWLARAEPRAYGLILEADRVSVARRGHGNAIAQARHHVILPLLDRSDRRTLIRWGLTEFRLRFGRESEGMWLPETAANTATMADLAHEGVRFVILAPRQAGRVRRLAGGPGEWVPVSESTIDTTRPYRCFPEGAGGPHIDVFFYDGGLASELAFGGALGSSDRLLDCILARVPPGRSGPVLIHAATDGETFGHHHKFGDRAMAYAVTRPSPITWTNYAAFLELAPPELEVELDEGSEGLGSSWSCAHGVARWRGGCDCGHEGGESQGWRAPLRAAIDALRARSRAVFAALAPRFLRDPGAALDEYEELLLDNSEARVERFLRTWSLAATEGSARGIALKLLDMEGQALGMFTSCGWFFSDLMDLGGLIVLRKAARVAERIAELTGEDPAPSFLPILERARSSRTTLNGAELYRREAETSRMGAPQIAATYVMLSGTRGALGLEPFREHRVAVDSRRGSVTDRASVERGGLVLTHALTGEATRLDYEWVRGPLYNSSVEVSEAGQGGGRRFRLEDLSYEDREEALACEARDVFVAAAYEPGLLQDFADTGAPALFEELLAHRIDQAGAAPSPAGFRACTDLIRLGRRAGVFRKEGEAQQILFGLLPSLGRAGLDREAEDELGALAAEALGFAPGVAAGIAPAFALEGSGR